MAEHGHRKNSWQHTRQRWTPRPDGLEESVQFMPGYNCPDDGWSGHGVHGMEITWLLRGPLGAVQLVAHTDWIPGALRPGHGLSPDGTRGWWSPSGQWSGDPHGGGIGIHKRAEAGETCPLLDGFCDYDESLCAADEFLRAFMDEGEQPIWDELERRYAEIGAVALDVQ